MQAIVPASYRSTLVRARPLDARISPLLKDALAIAKTTLKDIFRQGISLSEGSKDKESGNDVQSDSDLDMYDDEDVESEAKNNGRMEMLDAIIRSMQPPTHRPRLLVYGKPGFGQEHIGPAVLHLLEGCPTFGIDLVSLYADPSAKSQEEALVTAFREAARAAPSVRSFWTPVRVTRLTALGFFLFPRFSYTSSLVSATALSFLCVALGGHHLSTERLRKSLFLPRRGWIWGKRIPMLTFEVQLVTGVYRCCTYLTWMSGGVQRANHSEPLYFLRCGICPPYFQC